MKKLLILCGLVLTLSVFGQQANAQTPLGFGIRGGVNFANLNDVDSRPDSRTGLMLGVYFDYAISNSPVVLQPEVLYTQKGFKSGNDTFRLDYIEIPVLAKFNFITDGSVTPNVYFGPSIGFNINAEDDGGIITVGDPKDAVKNTEFGVVVGAGLDFGSLDLGVRYGAGLTEIFENGSKAKNGVLSITAGLGF